MADAPYPTDTKAKGWRFELDHQRIRQSDTWALAPAEIRPWLLMLWMVAWEQTPCGSLPSSDRLIAAQIGLPIKQFLRHKEVLLRGWWEATDNRLYHNVLIENVARMLASREKERIRQRNSRDKSQGSTGGVTRDKAVLQAVSHGSGK